ncbi:MAG: prepilin-type N-terminal cleavage/methylation domain-containing protein [Cyanobacteria bacterium REEB459]|nr:prepilin-type N-terminal cleavage/methylation domain-containing protein [Cyanobacteria bacterium REEB459]
MPKPYKASNLIRLVYRGGHRSGGFTLIELLVTLIVGSLIVTGLLYLVVELLQISRREEVLTRTQQDMKRALDYISRDVKEAVYVYPSPSAVVDPAVNPNPADTLLAQLTGSLPATATPILAFWRFDPIDVSQIPAALCADTNPKSTECKSLMVRQGTYSLVLYLQQKNTAADIWGGKSRILRYELSKYKNLATLEQNKGYSDPSGTCNTFRTWSKPPGRDPRKPCDSANAGTPASTIAVLTDYVNVPDTATAQTLCPTDYLQTPTTPESFYTCVSSGTRAFAGGTTSTNQVVKVFLQGSIYERDNQISPLGFLARASSLPTLESEILVRGILDKEPP